MNFENVLFVKKSKHIEIFNIHMEKITYEYDLKTPFGQETFSKILYVNWMLTPEQKEFFMTIERSIKNFMIETYQISESWIWKYSVRFKSNAFIRTKKKTENIIEANREYKVKIVLDSVWVNKKNKEFGLIWTC